MALRPRLYQRPRVSHKETNEVEIKKMHVVFLDVTPNHQLLTDSSFQVEMFTISETDACVDYMKSGVKDISLFISVTVVHTVIPMIDLINLIKFIYVFGIGGLRDASSIPSLTEYRFRGIFDDAEMMFKRFQEDIAETMKVSASKETSFQKIDDYDEKLRWWHTFDKILLHIRSTKTAEREFLTPIRDHYRDNKAELYLIDKFEETYSCNNSIRWYTRDCFLYRFVNTMLRRTQNDINTLFKLRFFVPNLLSGLRNAQVDQLNVLAYSCAVYRGQSISKEEIEMLKSRVGGLISANSILSTSRNEEVAKMFAVNEEYNGPVTSVIFNITMNSWSEKVITFPFADISHQADHVFESEVLFAPHAIFRVQSVEFIETDRMWLVHLDFEGGYWNEDFGSRSIFSSHGEQIYSRHLSKENMQFVGFQVLVDMVLRLEQSAYAKEELLEFCRPRCSEKEMKEFEETYKSTDALKWYTKTGFLYRILNESLRTETIDSIVKMRYYIQDLHNQLAELQPTFIDSLDGKEMVTLYRGQPMKISELNELKDNIHALSGWIVSCLQLKIKT